MHLGFLPAFSETREAVIQYMHSFALLLLVHVSAALFSACMHTPTHFFLFYGGDRMEFMLSLIY